MSISSHFEVRLPQFHPSFFAAELSSGQQSRGENSLELEALAAVHQFAIAVQSIAVSEMLPRTQDLIFVNLTTIEGQPYCLELTAKGWRVTSLRSDCMQGDFTRMEMFTQYYNSLYDLMDVISPGFRERFGENLSKGFEMCNNSRLSWHTSNDNIMDFGSGPVSECSEEECVWGDSSASTSTSTHCHRLKLGEHSPQGGQSRRTSLWASTLEPTQRCSRCSPALRRKQ